MKSMIENLIGNAVRNAAGEEALQMMKGISKIAAEQGGATMLDNYRLLGKRALVGVGVTLVVVQVASWAVGSIVSRKLEEKRIEETVRRVLAEERERERERESESESEEAAR